MGVLKEVRLANNVVIELDKVFHRQCGADLHVPRAHLVQSHHLLWDFSGWDGSLSSRIAL